MGLFAADGAFYFEFKHPLKNASIGFTFFCG
jgi:hypothetical protein